MADVCVQHAGIALGLMASRCLLTDILLIISLNSLLTTTVQSETTYTKNTKNTQTGKKSKQRRDKIGTKTNEAFNKTHNGPRLVTAIPSYTVDPSHML